MAKVGLRMQLKAIAIVHRAHQVDNDWDAVALGFIALFREMDPGFDEEAFRATVHLNDTYERKWSK